jgi:hypothetical protein
VFTSTAVQPVEQHLMHAASTLQLKVCSDDIFTVDMPLTIYRTDAIASSFQAIFCSSSCFS